MRKTMCEVCKAYAIYYVMGRSFCASCDEKEKTEKANESVVVTKKRRVGDIHIGGEALPEFK